MRAVPVFKDDGTRSPIFKIANSLISLATVSALLERSTAVTNVRRRRFLQPDVDDVHVEFLFLGRPYVVWEPFGDNSEYWIGPADMLADVADVPALERIEDIKILESIFERYKPLYRRVLDAMLFVKRP